MNGVGWTVTDVLAEDGFYHLYFGNPENGDYNAGEGNIAYGVATTPMLQLPDSGGYLMGSFDLLLLTEWLGFTPSDDGIVSPDRLVVDVIYSSGGVEVADRVFDSYDIGGATGDSEETFAYQTVNFELTAYAGDPVRFRFIFDSGDDVLNTYGGAFVDNFGVFSICDQPECNLAPDCDDGSTCTTDICELGACVNEKEDPLCCTANGDCDDDNPCTVEFCEEGQCTISIPDPTCCFEKEEVLETFDEDPEEWSFGSSDLDVGWSFIEGEEGEGFDGSGYLYFGNPETGQYETSSGSLVFGQAVTPAVTVGTSGISVLSFQLKLSTEWDSTPFVQLPFATDRFTVYAQSDSLGSIELWNSDLISGTTQGDWAKVEVGLAAFAGETLSFKLEFNTGDGDNNGFEGVLLDNMNVDVVCSNVECFSPFECSEDTDPCTIPACLDNLCGFEQVDTVECCIEKPKQSGEFDNDGQSSNSGYEVSAFTCAATSGFNAGNPNWDPAASNCVVDEEAAVQWHVSDNRSYAGAHSLYFGKVDLGRGRGSDVCGR